MRRMVRVTWFDASYSDEDAELVPILGAAVGWLHEEHRKFVRLALEAFDDESCRRFLCIPMANVVRIEEVTARDDSAAQEGTDAQ